MVLAYHVPEEFFDLAGFPFQLGVVVEVLVLATATSAENRAMGFYAMRGRFKDLNEICFGKVLIVAVDACFDDFSGEGEAYEDDPVVNSSDALCHISE